MISNREIKGQIDELTEQNQFLTQELQQIKELLQNQGQNQKQNSPQDQSQGQDQDQSQNEQQFHNQDQSQDQGHGSKSSKKQQQRGQGQGQGQSGQRMNSSGSQQTQIFDIANDFMKLKDLTSSLEQKMQQFTSGKSKSGGSLSEEDVINLVLSMMNGMIDWMMDFVSHPKDGYGQNQSQGQGQGEQSTQLQ